MQKRRKNRIPSQNGSYREFPLFISAKHGPKRTINIRIHGRQPSCRGSRMVRLARGSGGVLWDNGDRRKRPVQPWRDTVGLRNRAWNQNNLQVDLLRRNSEAHGPSWGSWAEVKMSCWAPSPYITSCVAPRTTSSSSFKYPIKGPFRLVLMCLPWYISAPNIIGLCMLTHHTKKSYLRDKKWMNVCCFAIPSRRSLYIPLDFDKGNFNKYNFWKIFPLTLRPYSATRVAYRHARGAKISRDTRSISKGAINVMQRLYECLDA